MSSRLRIGLSFIISALLLVSPSITFAADTKPQIDQKILGVWGVDSSGGYEFLADGTFIMQGSVKYGFDAADGVWHYWMPGVEHKVTADYKLSDDGKTLSINLKKGHSLVKLKRVK